MTVANECFTLIMTLVVESGLMFLYASIQCDGDDGSDSDQIHSKCPTTTVSVTSGFLVVILGIWLMPTFIHAMTGQTMRVYGLVSGILTVVVFAFKSEEGIEWVYEIFTEPDSDIIFNYVVFWIVLLCGCMSLFNPEHWASPVINMVPPEADRMFVKRLWVACLGLFGLVTVDMLLRLIITLIRADRLLSSKSMKRHRNSAQAQLALVQATILILCRPR